MEKSLSQMTPAELRLLADKKEKESKVIKTAFLKHDLYNFDPDKVELLPQWYITKEQIEAQMSNIKMGISLILPKGTEFECYLVNGKESWFDTANYGIEDMPEDWAKQNLENFQIN